MKVVLLSLMMVTADAGTPSPAPAADPKPALPAVTEQKLLTERAVKELACEEKNLKMSELVKTPPRQIGFVGCGKKVVFVNSLNGLWRAYSRTLSVAANGQPKAGEDPNRIDPVTAAEIANDNAIMSVMKGAQAQVMACYHAELKPADRPKPKHLFTQFTIRASGAVADVKITQSDFVSATFEPCVIAKLSALKFAQEKFDIAIRYTFDLLAPKAAASTPAAP